jgi:CBS domain containing-hemolysin-like protein
MEKHWPILLFVLSTIVFFVFGPNVPLGYAIAQSIGYSLLTFVAVFFVLLLIQWLTGRNFGLVAPKS